MPDSASVRMLGVRAGFSCGVRAGSGRRKWRRPCCCWWFLRGRQPRDSSGTVGSDCGENFSRTGQAFPVFRGVRKEDRRGEGVDEGIPGSVADAALPHSSLQPGTLSETVTFLYTREAVFSAPCPQKIKNIKFCHIRTLNVTKGH